MRAGDHGTGQRNYIRLYTATAKGDVMGKAPPQPVGGAMGEGSRRKGKVAARIYALRLRCLRGRLVQSQMLAGQRCSRAARAWVADPGHLTPVDACYHVRITVAVHVD